MRKARLNAASPGAPSWRSIRLAKVVGTGRWRRAAARVAGSALWLLRRKRASTPRFFLPALALVALALTAIACVPFDASGYAGKDLAADRRTERGHYRVTYVPSVSPPPINQLHTWTLRVLTPEGRPVEDAAIAVDGDMPEHKHGLPTKPEVTRHQGDGTYLVEGMKFQMGGWWVIDVAVDADGVTDTVRFTLVVG